MSIPSAPGMHAHNLADRAYPRRSIISTFAFASFSAGFVSSSTAAAVESSSIESSGRAASLGEAISDSRRGSLMSLKWPRWPCIREMRVETAESCGSWSSHVRRERLRASSRGESMISCVLCSAAEMVST